MKIAIVVQGRFHAFDLARGLLERGHDVRLLTNYPSRAVARFGVPARHVRSDVTHGVLVRAANRMPSVLAPSTVEPSLHKMFGSWAARQLAGEEWDVIHCWSGVSEELLRSTRVRARCRLLMRGSSDIRVQSRLLKEEEARTGAGLEQPSPWMIARELREYELADKILVLSTFSRESFEAEGVSPDKLRMVPLGVDVSAFRLTPQQINDRRDGILAGRPLRVLYVGHVSFRKGIFDLAAAVEQLGGNTSFEFSCVGRVTPEASAIVQRLGTRVAFKGHVPQAALPGVYAAADLFMFPTIEDGFPQVMAQAKAAALPIITTAHCAGVDIVTEGRDGWIVPIRNPGALVERLHWCSAHRREIACMTSRIHDEFRPRDWAEVAADFERVCVDVTTGTARAVRA
jgi:glycosyltransferase involved in cell wall biosynthesis